MRVSMMIRAGVLAGIAATFAACTEAPSAPRVTRAPGLSVSATSSSAVGRGRPNLDSTVQTTSFVVDPTVSQTYKFGNHAVRFPAYSICDPATSGYGESLWDSPCTPLATPITITATWTNKHGHAFVDFQPALRFVPAAAGDTANYVVLTLKDSYSVSSTGGYSILWQRPSDSLWVDEGSFDSTELAAIDPTGNTVSRRIKHFSGYNVSASVDACDPMLDSYCISTTAIIY